jgi:hypothetical protein
MTVWRQEVNTAHLWAQWCAIPEANRWIREATRLTSADEDARIGTLAWGAQVAAVSAVWRALSSVYRCLNLPCLGDPAYKQVMRDWYGGLENQSVDDAVAQKVNRVLGDGGEVMRRCAAAWVRAGNPAPTSEAMFCRVIVQNSLSYPDSQPVSQCLGGLTGDGICSFTGWDHGCMAIDAAAQGCDPWDWNDWAWYTPPHIGVGDGSSFCMIVRALPPLRLSFLAARALAEQLAARGAYATLDEARVAIFAANLETAAAVRPTILPAELAAAANLLPARVNELRQTSNSPAFAGTIAAIGAAAAATALVPVAGPIVAAILAGVGAIVALLPAAVGLQADRFGRVVPVFERAWIAGGAGLTEQPGYDVPEPASYRPPPVLGSLPTPIGVAPEARDAPRYEQVLTLLQTTESTGGGGTAPPGTGVSTPVVLAGLAGVGVLLWWLASD